MQTYSEGEVPLLGDAILARDDIIKVPGNDEVDDSVHNEHDKHQTHAECVLFTHWREQVIPLEPHSCNNVVLFTMFIVKKD